MSIEEKWERFRRACAWSWTLLQANPNRSAALARRDPRSPEAEALWQEADAAEPWLRTTTDHWRACWPA